VIYGRKNDLKLKEVQAKYGFLYNGYKDHSYFWEIVIMYRKTIIIFVQVLLAQFGKIVQALVIFLLLILAISLNTVRQPFGTLELNSLESLSLLTSAITVYCGLFYISDASFAENKSGCKP
jgi:hypothetical protein